MAKRKPAPAKPAATAHSAPPPPEAFTFGTSSTPHRQIETSNSSLHDLFQQQAMKMLDRTDLDAEQKQNILVAMSCPCCGAGGLSFTAKIKRRKRG
jgi:hypothetical protein